MGLCKNYKTHAYREKRDAESSFCLNPNGTKLFLKPLVPFITGDKNQAFLPQVGADLSKDTDMAIMD